MLARAVAGPELAGLAHQVEVAAHGAARVVAVVHAEQADDLERDGAHRHQGAEGDATGAKALLQPRHLERFEPALAQRGQRRLLHEAGLVAGGAPGRQPFVERGDGLGVEFVDRLEQRGQQPARPLAPVGRAG